MSELLSMVVPLETLSGWPEVANPTALQTLGLLVGIPGLAFIVIFTLGKASALINANKRQALAVTEPVWLGGGQLDSKDVAGALPAGPGSNGPESNGGGSNDGATKAHGEVGGASVRW